MDSKKQFRFVQLTVKIAVLLETCRTVQMLDLTSSIPKE